MNRLVPFFAQLVLGEFEPPLGYASRIAHANSFGPLRLFCAMFGFEARSIRRGDPEAIERLAGHSGVDPRSLGRFGFALAAKGREAMYGAEMIKSSMHSKTPLRYCPHCVCADIENSMERPSAAACLRAHWSLNFVTACEVHSVELVAAEPTDGPDFGHYVECHRNHIEAARSSSRSLAATECDLYFARRVLGVCQRPFSLDPYPFIPAFKMVEALGFLGAQSQRRDIGAVDRAKVRQAGFEIAKAGVDGIMAHFDSRLPKNGPANIDVYGRLAHPSSIMNIVLRNIDHPAFSELSTRLREHAVTHLGVSAGKEFLGRVVDTRSRISVAKAALEHRLSAADVVAKLIEGGTLDSEASKSHPASIIVPTEVIEPIIEELLKRTLAAEACEMLGVGRALLQQLSDEGLLDRHEFNKFKQPTIYRRQQLEALLRNVHAKAPIRDDAENYVSVEPASAITRCPVSQMIALVATNEISAVRIRSNTTGLLSVMVNPAEVLGVLTSSNYSHKFDRTVQANTRVSRELIAHGALRLPGQSDCSASVSDYFNPVSFARLRFECSRLREIAKILEMDADLVRAKLDASNIKPVLDGDPAYCYYRNCDLEGFI